MAGPESKSTEVKQEEEQEWSENQSPSANGMLQSVSIDGALLFAALVNRLNPNRPKSSETRTPVLVPVSTPVAQVDGIIRQLRRLSIEGDLFLKFPVQVWVFLGWDQTLPVISPTEVGQERFADGWLQVWIFGGVELGLRNDGWRSD